MSRMVAVLTGLVVVILAGIFILAFLPRGGFDSDLSAIGSDRPAVVLAFENYQPASMDAMDLMRQVRGDYEGRLYFLVADVGNPRNAEFLERHDPGPGQLMTFDRDGNLVRAAHLEGTAQALRERLRRDLGVSPATP